MKTDQRVARIATLSRRLRRAVWGVAGLIVLALALMLAIGFGEATIRIGDETLDLAQLPQGAILALVIVWFPGAVIVGWLLFLSDRLLALYERGEIFGVANARIIGTAGRLIAAVAILGSLERPLAAWWVSRFDVPVETWSFEPQLGTFLIGVGIIVVGHVMSLGAEMAEEQSLTI